MHRALKPLLVALLWATCAVPGFGQGGRFDYYLLALSWSPEYCHSHTGSPQCAPGKHFTFVVHGLWPEYNSGSGPEHCGSEPGLSDPSKMLDIMPDPGLIQHEWTTHGTCSGLSADQYFGLIRQAFSKIKIPPVFSQATHSVTMSPLQVKQAFQASNSSLQSSEITVSCPSNYLQAVETCLTKNLQPTPCAAPRDCHAHSIRVPAPQ